MKAKDIIKNGLIKENPTWVLILGMCPTLATTTSAINGMMMGLATTFVLLMSNIVISLLKSVIPDKVRIPAFIVIIATFVTIVQMVMQAFMPDMYETLGLFMGLGFTWALTLLGMVRELLGTGCFFGISLIGGADGMLLMILPAGGFLCLGFLMALINHLRSRNVKKV